MTETSGSMITFSPDGRWLATCNQNLCGFWETGSWKCVHNIAREAGATQVAIAFTDDSRLAAIATTPRDVRLIEAGSWREIANFEAPDPQFISHLCFSADGGYLAVATETKQIQLWDVRSIRRQLAAMNLDWDVPPLPAPPPDQFNGPIKVTVLESTNHPPAEANR